MSKENKLLGLLIELGDFYEEYVRVTKDGFQTISDTISLADEVVAVGRALIDYKQIVKAYKETTPESIKEIVSDFAESFDIDDDEAEEKIESMVGWLAATDEVVKKFL